MPMVACPHCAARAGQPCRTMSGWVLRRAHRGRVAAAERMFGITRKQR